MTIAHGIVAVVAILAALGVLAGDWMKKRGLNVASRRDHTDLREVEQEVYRRLYGDRRSQRLIVERHERADSRGRPGDAEASGCEPARRSPPHRIEDAGSRSWPSA